MQIRLLLLPLLYIQYMPVLAAEQDYTKYYQFINKAEAAYVTQHNVRDSYRWYDQAFNAYSKPYVKDAYIAAQIAFASGDTERMIQYLAVAFKNDMPLSAFPAAKMFRNLDSSNPALYQRVAILSEKYKESYPVDLQVRNEIDSMMHECDSLHETMGRNPELIHAHAIQEVAFRQYIVDRFLSKGAFPSERIIGLQTEQRDSNYLINHHLNDPFARGIAYFSNSKTMNKGVIMQFTQVTDKEEWTFMNRKALIPFIHYTCTYERYGKMLWQAVLHGYLHPKDWGMLQEMSYAWNHTRKLSVDECNYPKQDVYFNILHNSPLHPETNTYVTAPELIAKAEANRAAALMQSFSVDEQKKALEQSQGFLFFTGFMHMR